MALKPKQAETPSAPVEKKLKFDKSGQTVVPVKKPPETKPYEPKKMTPDEIAREMDKVKRQNEPVTEPPSKQSVNPKEFYGKPAPETIKTPANVNAPEAPKSVPAPKSAPAAVPAPKSVPAPAAAPKSAPAPAAAQATDAATAPKPRTKPEQKKKEEKKPVTPRIPIPGVSPEILSALQGGYVPTKSYTHFAEPRKTYGEETEVDKIRTSIENVARPGGKTRIAKQGEIKTKIIDENAKRVATIKRIIDDKKSTVIINPKLKNPDTDQN